MTSHDVRTASPAAAFALVLSTALAACPGRAAVECIDDTSCDLAAGGRCLINPATGSRWCGYPDGDCASGLQWSEGGVGDNLGGTCVPTTIDRYLGGFAFVSGRDLDKEIYLMAADGSAQVAVTHDPSDDTQPRWSPDGSRIAFLSTRRGIAELHVMAADGSGVTRLSDGDADDPAWSPDGRAIVFSSVRTGEPEMYVLRFEPPMSPLALVSPMAPTRLTFGGGAFPAWSPDGTRIAYERHGTIVIANADGSADHVITAGVDSEPAWDPTGNRLAYVHADAGGISNIYIVAADGSAPVALTHGALADRGPAWSPDGTRIAFIGGDDADRIVWVASVDGDTVTPIAPTDQLEPPVWLVDGAVVFAGTGGGDREVVRVDAMGGTPANLTNHPGDDDSAVPRPR